MPALRLFGRRWLLSSDDMPLPAAFCALFHFVSALCRPTRCSSQPVSLPCRLHARAPLFHAQVWCIILVVWFSRVAPPGDCAGGAVGRYYVAVGGVLAAFAVSVGLEVALVRTSLRGGPFEERQQRRAVVPLLYLDCASHACQVCAGGMCGGGRGWEG